MLGECCIGHAEASEDVLKVLEDEEASTLII